MKKMEIHMDTERRLYLKDINGKEYHFWPLGMGIPVQFVIETQEEREEKEKERKEREKLQYELDIQERKIRESNKSWWERLFDKY
jgi:hypothetical protein